MKTYAKLNRYGEEIAAGQLLDLSTTLDTGQVAYLYRGGVTYVQVKRLVATAAPVAAARPAAPQAAVTRAAPARPALPDISELLDVAFGPEPAR